MKRAFVLGISLLFGIITLWAQVPQHFSYQAVIRNNDGSATASQKVSVRVSILQGSESGTVMYTETHSVKSNPNGLITLQIGDGFPVNGSFSAIDWQHGPFFLKTEVDPNGGNNLSLVSVQQLLSVPYALYAEKAGSVKDAVDKGYVDNQDNRLKDYVDSLWALSPSVDTNKIGAPVVVTDSVSVYRHYATVSGQVLSDGGELVMSRGFCYGTKPNPTISDNYILQGTGKGGFSGAITGLQDSVTYYVRAFATNRHGTTYGAQQVISIKSDNYNTCGIFKVSDTSYVIFSPGIMQFEKDGSAHFANYQYDTLGGWSAYRGYSGEWRMLTHNEVEYLSAYHCGFIASIDGLEGIVLMPYNCVIPQEFKEIWPFIQLFFSHKNPDGKVFPVSKEQWDYLETAGAVFFPKGIYWLPWEYIGDYNTNQIYAFWAMYVRTNLGIYDYNISPVVKNVKTFPNIKYKFRLVQDVKINK